jgi:hypothetical protein
LVNSFLIIYYSKNFFLASIDWMMQESSGVASDYITTTIQFLEDTFRAFTHLPVRFFFEEIIEKRIIILLIKKIIFFYFFFLEKSKLVD